MQVLRVRGSERHPVEGKASERIDPNVYAGMRLHFHRFPVPCQDLGGSWRAMGHTLFTAPHFFLSFFSNVGGRRVVTGWEGVE